MRHSSREWFFLQVLLLTCSLVSAQQPYSLIHYNESILPQTSVGNIQQDADGYLWMSTQFGIVRFDGEKVRVFTTNNLRGLSSNRLRLCSMGPDKSIYFLDESNILLKVISPNQFETIAVSELKKKWMPIGASEYNNDFALIPLPIGKTYSQFCQQLQIDTTREFLKTYAIDQTTGYFFYVDIDQHPRLCFYNGKNYSLLGYGNTFKAQHTFKLNNSIFAQVSATSALVLNGADASRKIPVSGFTNEHYRVFQDESQVVFSNETGAFFYSSGKLFQYELKNGSLVASLIFEDLPCKGVFNVMREKATGDYLISTKSMGFYRIKKQQFSVINLKAEGREGDSRFQDNMVYALAPWDVNNVFCTGFITPVKGNGVSRRFDPTTAFRFNYYFLYKKDEANFWLSLNDGSNSYIQNFNKITGKYTPIGQTVLPRAVIEMNDGSTILLAQSGLKLVKNSRATTLFHSVKLEFTTAAKISEDRIAIGTSEGLFYWLVKEKSLVPVRYKVPLKVRFIYKDKRGRVWFTSYGQGIFHVSGDAITAIPSDNSGYLGIAHHIMEDKLDNFWISTNHGLFRLAYKPLLSIVSGQSDQLYYEYFDKTDGFNTNEFNGGCFPSGINQAETGKMFFPSMDGIVKFTPDSIRSMSLNSAIYFDEIEVNDTGKISTVPDRPVFDNKTSNIAIHFSSPYYGHVENLKFSYALSTSPDHWIDLKGSRTIPLTNLPGGSYSVVLKKEDASNAPVLVSFHFEIQKKFSETLLFRFLLLALIIALVYFYFRARLIYLGNERKRLESEVALRTADQIKLIDQMKLNIEQLKKLQEEMEQMIEHKENVMAVLIHDIKSPLYFLDTVAGHLDRKLETNSIDTNKKIASEISFSLSRLYIFTQDFAIWLDVSRPGFIQKQEWVDLDKIIGDVLKMYQVIIERKAITVHHSDTEITAFGDERMVKTVIRNLVDNAIKNSAGGEFYISCQLLPESDQCQVNIEDQGTGMSDTDLNALNDYFRYPESQKAFAGAGFGHKVIKDFLEKLHGGIRYEKNLSGGITVILQLPVNGK